MTPALLSFFRSSSFGPRLVYVSSLDLMKGIETAPLVSEGVDLDDAIEDLSGRVAPEVFERAIQGDPTLAEAIPPSQRLRAIALIRDDVRGILTGLSDLVRQRQVSTEDQLKRIIDLSAEALARHTCERLRIEMENTLLEKRNQELRTENEELGVRNEALRGQVGKAEEQIQWLNQEVADARKEARTDKVTTLPSRRHLDEVLENEIRLSALSGRPVSVLMYDLDRFKEINDIHGHPMGDKVLEGLGRTFNQFKVFAGRYGGDEIVVILPNTGKEEAVVFAHQMYKAVNQQPILIKDRKGNQLQADISASIGIGVYEGGVKDTVLGKMLNADRSALSHEEQKERGEWLEGVVFDTLRAADDCLSILKGGRADASGKIEGHRGQIAVNDEVYTHEQVERMIQEVEARKGAEVAKEGAKPFTPGPR